MKDARRFVGALAAVALGLACAHMAKREPSAVEEAYVPGLGEMMSATQMRHVKLWYAGKARNWSLADYEMDELEEGFADAARFHPQHKDSPRPLTELIPEFTDGPVAALRKAIAEQSRRGFVTAFDELTQGCNGCHSAAQFSFNVVQRPTLNPYGNQDFAPPRPSRAKP
jgi:hypothetical protein